MRSQSTARKVLKWAGWLAGGALALAICLYLVLLVINWRDREPSAAALRFDALYRDRPRVADADNAFIYVHGFSVSRSDDPRVQGARRVEWLQRTAGASEFLGGDDPAPDNVEYRALRSPGITAVVEACRSTTAECAALLEGDVALLQDWLDSEAWLLGRYQQLLRHGGWLETVPFDERTPLPSYGAVMDGQKLHLAKALLLARAKDAAGVRELLAEDVGFWRMVAASSDVLITRMIATAALLRTFKTGNLVLRQLPPELVEQGMPAEWDRPLTGPELSLRLTLAGEWTFMQAIVNRETAYRDEWIHDGDPDSVQRVLAFLAKQLYQSQASANERAEQFEKLLTVMDVPLREYPQAIERLAADFPEEGEFSVSFYNPVGKMLLEGTVSQFVPYFVRVSDIEGVRRAAVLASRLRSRKVPPDAVAAELVATDIKDPYTDGALGWDMKARAIVFTGLEKSGRGRHLLTY